MAKEVTHIYGASGSGTSTLGRYIGDNLGRKPVLGRKPGDTQVSLQGNP